MKFRRAQHTLNLRLIEKFYTSILGFKVLGEFTDHDGYNGIFLGFENENWELEFTEDGSKCDHSQNEDDLLVFYPSNEANFNQIVKNINQNNIEIHEAKNPYWKENGIYIKDPDNYGIIVVKV